MYKPKFYRQKFYRFQIQTFDQHFDDFRQTIQHSAMNKSSQMKMIAKFSEPEIKSYLWLLA